MLLGDPTQLVGAVIDGRYALSRYIGSGAFACVFEANEVLSGEHVARVAVKLITSTEPDVGARLLAEVRAMAQLRHPNIISYLSCGVVQDGPLAGVHYIVTELAQRTLADAVGHEPSAAEETARRVAEDMSSALAHIHGQGAVHRDVKPTNILQVDGRWKLADFGLARATGGGMATATRGAGSLLYTAPEVLDGHVGPPSDVYSLGVTLLECLTGHGAHTGATDAEFMHNLLTRPAAIPAGLPSTWRAALGRCLSRDHAQRCSAAELGEIVAAGGSDETPVVRPQAAQPEPAARSAPVARAAAPADAAQRAPARGGGSGLPRGLLFGGVCVALAMLVWGVWALVGGAGGQSGEDSQAAGTQGVVGDPTPAPLRPPGEGRTAGEETTGPADDSHAAGTQDVVDNPAPAPLWPPEEGRTAGDEITGPDGGTYVWVPAGEFSMGSEDGAGDEKPVHRVRITNGFWLSKCEVTNAQYRRFSKATGREFPSDSDQGDEHPVVEVSWVDAQAYCAHFGLRLPTEAEWEYAARGAKGREYPWGDEWDSERCCNHENKGPGGRTYPVGSFATGASWCGAPDMAGNVWEWCGDWYQERYYDVSLGTDPTGPAFGETRVVRGGGWGHDAANFRSAFRGEYVPADLAARLYAVGFRPVVARR